MRRSAHTAALAPVYYCVLRTQGEHEACTNGEERQALYALLDWTRKRFAVRIHAFCWTTHDLRLLFEVSRWPAEEFIRGLAWTRVPWARIVALAHDPSGAHDGGSQDETRSPTLGRMRDGLRGATPPAQRVGVSER
jgi:hypothetical protein